MTLKRMALASIIAASMVLGGCTRRMLDFTIVSTKNIDMSRASTLVRGSDRTTGDDLAHIIIFIPTGNPNMKEAVDRALAKVPGAVALLDGVIYHTYWWAILYGQNSFTIEGTPLIDPALLKKSGAIELKSNYMSVYEDPETKEMTLAYLSEAEYERIHAAVQEGDVRTPQTLVNAQP